MGPWSAPAWDHRRWNKKKRKKKKQIKLLRGKKEPLLPSFQWVQPASCLSKHLHLPAQPKEERKTEISEGIYSQRGPERGVWLVQGPPPARRRGGGGWWLISAASRVCRRRRRHPGLRRGPHRRPERVPWPWPRIRGAQSGGPGSWPWDTQIRPSASQLQGGRGFMPMTTRPEETQLVKMIQKGGQI